MTNKTPTATPVVFKPTPTAPIPGAMHDAGAPAVPPANISPAWVEGFVRTLAPSKKPAR
jgi:hypothetical protein